MTRLAPRDVHILTVVGGGIVGVSLSGLGALDFAEALDPARVDQGIRALEGAVWLGLGFAFILVSLVIIPALRAARIEAAKLR